MIKVLSFLSNENCFAGHSRGPCGSHEARWPRFEHHLIIVFTITYFKRLRYQYTFHSLLSCKVCHGHKMLTLLLSNALRSL